MFIPPQLLAKAEILSAKFQADPGTDLSEDALANTVSWLIETFAIKRSLALTLAIARRIGGEHCIRVVGEDGITRFALISENPHSPGSEVSGTGVSILGKAPITDFVRDLSGDDSPSLQVGIAPSEREPNDQDKALVRLASLFPWYSDVLTLPARSIRTCAVVEACLELGMPERLLKN